MKAETLKKAILQYAMEGKLVPQDPNDEPASELLKRIKAEKEQLIKDGKLKKEKPLPQITEDEIPYELPQGWKWVRLVDIGFTQTGTTPSTSHSEYFNGEYPFIKPASILSNGKVNYIGETLTEIGLRNGRVITPNTVLMVCIGGSIGKVGIIDRVSSFNQQINSVTCYIEEMSKYIFYCLFSPYFYNTVLNIAPQTTLPIISKGKWEQILLPLPPLEEQKRIVEKLEEILPLVEEYGKNEEKLSKLNETLPKKIRQSILQHAVQGKLVPQNPNDEPASELLKHIKAEKEQLIKDGKIKKEKPLPPITEDEIPYELPQGWEWVRLGKIINLTSGQDLESKHYNSSHNGIPYITGASNIEDDKIIINRWTEYPKSKAYKGNLLITCKGTIGTMALLQESIVHIARQIMAIATYDNVYINFTKIVLETYVESLKQNAKSMIPGISRDMILNIVFPLPPIAEQKRIVAKVDELMQLVDKLEM